MNGTVFNYADTLEEALNRHPCKHCGKHYNNHMTLGQEEVDRAREEGCIVEICEKRRRFTYTEDLECHQDKAYFCVVITPPDDPMTEEDMMEIST